MARRAGSRANPAGCSTARRHTSDGKVFAAWLSTVDEHDVRALKLGKKADANWQRAVELTKQLDRYAYGVRIQFSDTEIDQARAAGCDDRVRARCADHR